MSVWEREYNRLLRLGREKGEVVEADEGPGSSGHRGMPRFAVKAAHVIIKVPTTFELVDVSIAGLSFVSPNKFTIGEVLMLTLDKAFVIEAEVKDCKPETYGEGKQQQGYRVGCSFTDQEQGLQLLVMLKELEKY
ncbi:MAG: PilZ domain-containing protein [Deltaproteobacteria bacterium]|nr:PilZ domain-containing protein [Deltaproteobacteria bacterium]